MPTSRPPDCWTCIELSTWPPRLPKREKSMKRRYSLRLITTRRSYSTLEIAKLLNTHPQTIRSWRQHGLASIDETSHSPLFLGSEVKRFLSEQQQKRRVKLGPDEYYCLKCKSAVHAIHESYEETGNLIGHNRQSIIHIGFCSKCGKSLRKFGIINNQLLVGQKEINRELPSPLYHSLSSRKD